MPRLPWSVRHIFGWWQEIAAGRQNGMAVNGLSWAEMLAWSHLTQVFPTPDEWRLVRMIDSIFIEVMRADT